MQVRDWFSVCKSGVPSVESAGCSGCPAVSRIYNGADQVKELVFGNRRIATFEVANMLEISFRPHDSILKDYLNMHLISPYLCPTSWVRSRAELSHCVPGPSRETWKHLFTYFSKLQYCVKGMENQLYHHDSSRITWHLPSSNTVLHTLCYLVAWSLDLLYKVSRILFWKGKINSGAYCLTPHTKEIIFVYVQLKVQLDVLFMYSLFLSIFSSTCFGCCCTHPQVLQL
jgi:hypothetical protein